MCKNKISQGISCQYALTFQMHSLFTCSHTSCITFWEYPRDSADQQEGIVVLYAKPLEENEC